VCIFQRTFLINIYNICRSPQYPGDSLIKICNENYILGMRKNIGMGKKIPIIIFGFWFHKKVDVIVIGKGKQVIKGSKRGSGRLGRMRSGQRLAPRSAYDAASKTRGPAVPILFTILNKIFFQKILVSCAYLSYWNVVNQTRYEIGYIVVLFRYVYRLKVFSTVGTYSS